MELLDHLQLFCLLFWTSVSLAASATTSQGGNTSALWPDYANFTTVSTALTESIHSEIPFTYFETIIDELTVHINGYMSFGPQYTAVAPPAPTKWPQAPKIMAAYWTDVPKGFRSPLPRLYTYMDEGRLTNVTRESSLIRYVKNLIAEPDFEPLVVIAATWVDVRPQQKDKFPNDTASFQLLVATDSRVTYAIRGYEQVFQSPELGAQTYYSTAYSRALGERPMLSSSGTHTGLEVIPLGTKTPNKDPYNCVQKAIPAHARLERSNTFLPACPCYVKQAAIEPQLRLSDVSSRCYQSTAPPQGHTLLQLCCYNAYGILVNVTKEARVPLSANSSDRTLQEAYETCCADGSGLCQWFLMKIGRPNCVNNMTLLNTNALPRFTDPVETVKISASPTQRYTYVKRFTTNKTPVNFAASGVFNSSHGFKLDPKGTLEWRVSEELSELRKLSYPQQLVIYATDNNNISAQFVQLYDLCLCEHTSQCIKDSFISYYHHSSPRELYGYIGPDTYEKGNVNLMYCDCKGNATGRFCEEPPNACDDCLIADTSVCNTNPQVYCPPCPLGYYRDGRQCRAGSITKPGTSGNISTAQAWIVVFLAFLSATLLDWSNVN